MQHWLQIHYQSMFVKSDGNHGWIEAEGYPGTKKIKRHIVNYMEGGKESFKHKMKLYEEIL